MTQLSFFSADLTPPETADLGGLLAGHGQLVASAAGVRLSILLDQPWRARALLRELRVRDLAASISSTSDASLLRADWCTGLTPLARAWTRGAVKHVPDQLVPGPGFLRCWLLAAGRPDEVGFVLGLDPRSPDTHEPLAGGLARAGLAPTLLGARGGGPALRVVGHRRLVRLAELVGSRPPEAPAGAFPDPGR